MPITISIPDNLRQSVEAASGGRNTVIYDVKGYPSIMCVIPKFNLQDIDPSLGTGVHPAFLVNGVEKPEIFIGKFQLFMMGLLFLYLINHLLLVLTLILLNPELLIKVLVGISLMYLNGLLLLCSV